MIKRFFLLFVIAVALSCSDEKETTPIASRPISPVVDGQVQIGSQVWKTKNLNVSHYRNGDIIPQVTDPTEWANLTTGAWCYYNNDPANGSSYGKLYNWYAVNDLRGIAPVGWHVPTDADWTVLTTFLGGEAYAGGMMKSTTGWNSPNTGANNGSHLTGLPSGLRTQNGIYASLGSCTYIWATTEFDSTKGIVRGLYNNYNLVSRTLPLKLFGCSVRCIKD